jgi:hypothetical protein
VARFWTPETAGRDCHPHTDGKVPFGHDLLGRRPLHHCSASAFLLCSITQPCVASPVKRYRSQPANPLADRRTRRREVTSLRVGQIVVCIDDTWDYVPLHMTKCPNRPVRGLIYTVRAVMPEDEYEEGILLEEIMNAAAWFGAY